MIDGWNELFRTSSLIVYCTVHTWKFYMLSSTSGTSLIALPLLGEGLNSTSRLTPNGRNKKKKLPMHMPWNLKIQQVFNKTIKTRDPNSTINSFTIFNKKLQSNNQEWWFKFRTFLNFLFILEITPIMWITWKDNHILHVSLSILTVKR